MVRAQLTNNRTAGVGRHYPLNFVHVTTIIQRYMWTNVDTVRIAK